MNMIIENAGIDLETMTEGGMTEEGEGVEVGAERGSARLCAAPVRLMATTNALRLLRHRVMVWQRLGMTREICIPRVIEETVHRATGLPFHRMAAAMTILKGVCLSLIMITRTHMTS